MARLSECLGDIESRAHSVSSTNASTIRSVPAETVNSTFVGACSRLVPAMIRLRRSRNARMSMCCRASSAWSAKARARHGQVWHLRRQFESSCDHCCQAPRHSKQRACSGRRVAVVLADPFRSKSFRLAGSARRFDQVRPSAVCSGSLAAASNQDRRLETEGRRAGARGTLLGRLPLRPQGIG